MASVHKRRRLDNITYPGECVSTDIYPTAVSHCRSTEGLRRHGIVLVALVCQ